MSPVTEGGPPLCVQRLSTATAECRLSAAAPRLTSSDEHTTKLIQQRRKHESMSLVIDTNSSDSVFERS